MAKENSKGKSTIKFILILLLSFILVPIGIITLIYNTNDSFERIINNNFRNAPGFIGEHFNKYPTEEERIEKINHLAEYYVTLDKTVTADKMYIIKKDDEGLYYDIIQVMKNKSFRYSEDVIRLVRDIELRKDLLVSIYNEIENDKETRLDDEAKRLEKLKTYLAVKEIEEKDLKKKDQIEFLVSVFSRMQEKKAVETLFFLDEEKKNKIISGFDIRKKGKIESLLKEKRTNNDELVDLAKIYEVKDSKESFQEIGCVGKFSIVELSIIYSNLNIEKSAEILMNSKDTKFSDDLFTEIRTYERLTGKTESITLRISQELNRLNVYNSKIKELVEIYEKMKPTDTAKIVEKMMVDDSSIMLDVLRNMKKSTVSQILNSMDTRKATEITRKLAM